MRLLIIMLVLLPFLTGCETVKKGVQDISDSLDFEKARAKSTEESPLPTAQTRLKSGIAQYEEGNYGEAQRLLQASLAEGLSRTDQARAYKHLAFIYCVTERKAQCRQEFQNALSADPKFKLTPAEAGHPSWGPVYRSVAGH